MPWDELKPRRFAAFEQEPDYKNHELYFGHLGGAGGTREGRFAELAEEDLDWERVDRQPIQAEAARRGTAESGAREAEAGREGARR